MMGEGFVSLAGSLLAVVLVLLLAYWSTRILGKNYIKAASGKRIKILEQMRIGADKQIVLLKLQSRVYLIGVSQTGFQLLDQMEDEFPELETEESREDAPDFKKLLERYAENYHKRKGGDK